MFLILITRFSEVVVWAFIFYYSLSSFPHFMQKKRISFYQGQSLIKLNISWWNKSMKIISSCRGVLAEVVVRRCSVKNIFLKISQNLQKKTFIRVSLLIKSQAAPAILLKKEILEKMFSCEFCEIFKSTSGGCFRYMIYFCKKAP